MKNLSGWRIFRWGLSHFEPSKSASFSRLSTFIILMLGAIGASSAIPFMLKHSIDGLVVGGGFSSHIIWALACYVVTWAFVQVTHYAKELLAFPFLEEVVQKISTKLFEHAMRTPLRVIQNLNPGDFLELLKRIQVTVPELYFVLCCVIAPLVLEIALAVTLIGWFYGSIYVVYLLGTVGIYIFFVQLFSQSAQLVRRQFNQNALHATRKAAEALDHIEVVKAYNQEAHEEREYGASLGRANDLEKAFLTLHTSVHLGEAFIIAAGVTGVALAAAQQVVHGNFSLGDFALLYSYVLHFAAPLSFVGHVVKHVRSGIVDLKSVYEFLSEHEPEVDRGKNIVVTAGRVSFSNVSFSYSDTPVLEDFSLDIAAGEVVAIVGKTGSGKSTLARLLLRQHEPDVGSISIDGTAITSVKRSSVRQNIGYVPQETTMLHETVGYNMMYGMRNISNADREKAAQYAMVEDVIKKLPLGYETYVGERGVYLSGGERQRVALARLFLTKAPILLLDEPTSSLDMLTERKVLKNLQRASAGKTVIMIAHRLATITHADTIVFLDQGKIIEQGSHAKLLKARGAYWSLWSAQHKGGAS